MKAYSFFIDKLSGSHKDFSNNVKDSHEEIQKQHNTLIGTIRSTTDMNDAKKLLGELEANHNKLVEENGDLIAQQQEKIEKVKDETYGWVEALDQTADAYIWWWSIISSPWEEEIDKVTGAIENQSHKTLEQKNSKKALMEAEIQYNKLLREQLPLLHEIALVEYDIANAHRAGSVT